MNMPPDFFILCGIAGLFGLIFWLVIFLLLDLTEYLDRRKKRKDARR